MNEHVTPREENNDLFVVAIDFGTSYTGYAYAQRDSYETHPLRIYGMKIDNNQQLRKVPTSILLKPDNSFHSFGKTAEDTYVQKFDNDMRDWKLFKNFKMCLYNAKDKAEITKMILALEPECAALYCGTQILCLRDTLQKELLRVVGPGARYILLDMGGGTVDITAHAVNSDFTYDELFAANGGPWGGENVNVAFQEYLCKIFTKPVFSEFCKENTEDFYDLMDVFDRKKRVFNFSSDDKYVVIKLPSVLKECFPPHTLSDLAVIWRDKLKIPTKHMIGFFGKTLDEISRHIKELLKAKELKDINNVILVGGFSVPNIVKDRLKEVFPKGTEFYCPENSEVATLQGAVLYGQSKIHTTYEKPKPRIRAPIINSRRSRFTYGIDSHLHFNPAQHPKNRKFRDGNEVFCKDCFWVFLRAGAKISRTKKDMMRTFTVDKDSKTLDVVIYKTENPNPQFVDDPGCLKIGTLVVDMAGVGTPNREIKIGLQYNDTELNVYAINNRDEIVKTTFDLLA